MCNDVVEALEWLASAKAENDSWTQVPVAHPTTCTSGPQRSQKPSKASTTPTLVTPAPVIAPIPMHAHALPPAPPPTLRPAPSCVPLPAPHAFTTPITETSVSASTSTNAGASTSTSTQALKKRHRSNSGPSHRYAHTNLACLHIRNITSPTICVMLLHVLLLPLSPSTSHLIVRCDTAATSLPRHVSFNRVM